MGWALVVRRGHPELRSLHQMLHVPGPIVCRLMPEGVLQVVQERDMHRKDRKDGGGRSGARRRKEAWRPQARLNRCLLNSGPRRTQPAVRSGQSKHGPGQNIRKHSFAGLLEGLTRSAVQLERGGTPSPELIRSLTSSCRLLGASEEAGAGDWYACAASWHAGLNELLATKQRDPTKEWKTQASSWLKPKKCKTWGAGGRGGGA